MSGLESCDFSCDFSVILVSKGLKRGRQGATCRITVILSDSSDFNVILATVTQNLKSHQKSPAFFAVFKSIPKIIKMDLYLSFITSTIPAKLIGLVKELRNCWRRC